MNGISPSLRLALLVDADSVPAACVDGLMEDLFLLGQATVREAYGDFRVVSSEPWSIACRKHDILEIQFAGYAGGKNTADVAIVVRAMDLLHGREIDGLAWSPATQTIWRSSPGSRPGVCPSTCSVRSTRRSVNGGVKVDHRAAQK